MNKTTHFYLVPVVRGEDEKLLETFLRQHRYNFYMPAVLHHDDVLDEFNKGVALGKILERLIKGGDTKN